MVFFALQGNIPVNAQDIHSKIKTKFICCDPGCNSHLSFIDSFTRTIKKNTPDGQVTKDITVSSHFKHNTDKNSNGQNACSIENFINLIGDTQAREFYRFWTNFFTYESIKNTFNSESKFHVLFENIMIHTSSKELTLKQIKNKEHYARNNEKITWILDTNESVRQEIKREIIRRKYWDNGQVLFSKYYIVSNTNYYYDFELFDYTKSDVYLDVGANKLLKLIGYTFQGFEVEPIEIKTFLNLFIKITKPNVEIPTREKIKGITFYIHNEVLITTEIKYDKIKEKLNKFKIDNENNLTHVKSQKYHCKYLELENQLKTQYNVDYCENIQNKIYNNKIIDNYSTDCLKFIWLINEDNYDKNIVQMTCSICNTNYQGNKLVTNICNECLKFKEDNKSIFENYFFNKIERIMYKSNKYDFSFYVKVWKLNSRNFYSDFNQMGLNKFKLCRDCISSNFKCLYYEKLNNLCLDCDEKINKLIYKNILSQKYHFTKCKKNYAELVTIFSNNEDNFNNFIKKTDMSKMFLCTHCLANNYNLPVGQYVNLCLICETQRKKQLYNLILNKKELRNNYSFDELVVIWNLNSQDFYSYYKTINPKILSYCNECVKKFFHDNQYYVFDCETCISQNLYNDIINNKIPFNKIKAKCSFEKIIKIFDEHKDDFCIFYFKNCTVCECHIKEHYNETKFTCDEYENLVTYKNIKSNLKLLDDYNKIRTFEQMENIWKTHSDNFFNFYKNNFCSNLCVDCVKNHYDEKISKCDNCDLANIVLPLIEKPYSIYNLKYSFNNFVKMFELQGKSFINFLNINWPKTSNMCVNCISLNFDDNLKKDLYGFPLVNLCANHLKTNQPKIAH